jgi:hypothetical protein
MNHAKHSLLTAAYLFYYATDVAQQEGSENNGLLTKRLRDLIGDAIIVAHQAGFDVFNALTLMDNMQFIQDLKVRVTSFLLGVRAVTFVYSLGLGMACSTSTCSTGGLLLCRASKLSMEYRKAGALAWSCSKHDQMYHPVQIL